MTVRLLKPYAQRPVNSLATFDASVEAGLIAANKASADLTGGFRYFAPRPGLMLQSKQVAVGAVTLKMEERTTAMLPEGQVLKVTGATGAAGEVTRTGTSDKWAVGVGTSLTLGPYSGTQQLLITCTAGSIDAVVADATLTAAQVATNPAGVAVGVRGPGGVDVAILVMGQSTELGSVYPTLTYTTASASGTGTLATITTSIANNLPVGDVVLGRVSGMTPAGYNTSGNVAMTVGGTWPNCTLTYASTATGAQTVAGTLIIDQEATAPDVFASQRFPAQRQPFGPAVTYAGGYWPGVYDALFDAGYNAHIVNAAIGSASLITDFVGRYAVYAASTTYRNARAPLGNGDAGCVGSLAIPSGTTLLLECTAGGTLTYASLKSQIPVATTVGSAFNLDYLATATGGVTGASPPAWTGRAVGDQIVDGGITWTVRSLNVATDTNPSIKNPAYTTNPVFVEGMYGFDPLGLINRAFAEFERAARGKVQRMLYFANAQADVSASQGAYQLAVSSLGNYSAKRGIKTAFGISIFNPNTSTANYDKLQAALDVSIPALQASYPNKVFYGANLSTGTDIGRVHGSGNLFLESDNGHLGGGSGENVHPQARTAKACVTPVTNAILSALTA